MSNELVPATALVQSKFADDASFKEVSTTSSFLPRIKHMQASADEVKDPRIKAQMSHFYLIPQKDVYIDLTSEFICLPLSWRPKAMDMSDAKKIISVYNNKSAEFNRIKDRSEVKESKCVYGPEYLLWLPGEKSFATFFFSSKTARREAPNLKALLGKGATVKSKYIKTPNYSWYGPEITICSQQFELPDHDEMVSVANKFANPPDDETEAAPEGAEERDR